MVLLQGLLFLFVPAISLAQTYEQVRLPLNSRENYRNGNKINQSVINLLTYGNEKLLASWNTNFELDYRFTTNGSDAIFEAHAMRASGNQTYLDFDLKEALFPDIFYGAYSINGSLSTPFKVSVPDLPSTVSIGNQRIERGSQPSGSIQSFAFSEVKVQHLQTITQQINQYWAVSAFAEQVLKESSKLENFSDEKIALLFITREKIRKALLLIKETAGFAAIKNAGNDPAGLDQKIPEYERMMVRLTTLLESELDRNTDKALLMKEIASAYRSFNLKTYRKAYLEDFKSHELILKTARIYPDDDFYKITAKVVDPDLGLNLAGKIAFEWVLLADSLQETGDFVNSLSLYEDAQNILENQGQKNAAAETAQRVESTKLGLLRSYLQIAAKALKAGNDSLSRVYQLKSNYFVNKYPQNNLINRIADESDVLIQTYLEKGNSLYDRQHYNEAISLFEEALSTAKSYYNNHYNEQINQALFRAYRYVFLDLVQTAEQYYQIGEVQQAKSRLKIATDYQSDHFQFLRTSNEAVYLQNKMNGNQSQQAPTASNENFSRGANSLRNPFNVENVSNINQLNTTESDVIQLVKNAQLKVWANEMDAAWRIYEKAAEMAQLSHLDKKKAVADAFQELDQRMIDRICLNNKFKRDDLMKAAHRMIAQKDFSQLQATLQEVIKLGADNHGCVLDVKEAETLMDEYELLFQYQNDYAEVLNRLYGSGLKAAIPMYNFFDQQLEQYQLQKFGVTHQNLKVFVKNQNSSHLTLQTIAFFVEQMDTEMMLSYLQLLINQEFDFHQTIELQQKMATLLAVADIQNQENNPKLRINALLGDDKRFSEMKKSYLRSVKKLSKINHSSSKDKK